jgi:hypothetical protein
LKPAWERNYSILLYRTDEISQGSKPSQMHSVSLHLLQLRNSILSSTLWVEQVFVTFKLVPQCIQESRKKWVYINQLTLYKREVQRRHFPHSSSIFSSPTNITPPPPHKRTSTHMDLIELKR